MRKNRPHAPPRFDPDAATALAQRLREQGHSLSQIGVRLRNAKLTPERGGKWHPGLDSEAVMLAWKGLAAVSNGSACTSHSYAPSHVLQAMGLDKDQVRSALRISWCHLTEDPPWSAMADAVNQWERARGRAAVTHRTYGYGSRGP